MLSLSRNHLYYWIAGICLSGFMILFSLRYFPRAFPIVNLKITMDRNQALKEASSIAKNQHLGPLDCRQTASFEGDDLVKNFVELQGGGAAAFNAMVTGTLFSPYTWQVRHFKEFETNEVVVLFKPDGVPYGFVEKIAEEKMGPSIEPQEAEVIAKRVATTDWQINFADYTRVEQSKETHPNGRADHTFVYERPNDRIGKEGRYRLRIVVSGDTVSQIMHFVKVPESFKHTYQEMRSSNNTISTAALIAMYLIYFLGIGLCGLIFLQRRRWLKWRVAIIVGLIMTLLEAASNISNYPLIWFSYDTTTPIHGYILQYLLSIIISSTKTFIMFTGIVAIAEGLTRKAFGDHPQFWKIWSKEAATSFQVVGRTIAGYLWASLDVAYVITFYLLTSKYLGWWQPSGQLYDPNVLASYLPWLNASVPALHAGFLEECLFRAFPIAAAALLAQKYGKRKWWLIGAFVMQALIFGAGHANYPAQPAYARLVELSLFSLWAGFIYLRFGLIPCIVNHVVYDLIWYSVPIFISTAAYAWFDETVVLLIGAIPLFVLLFRWIQKGHLQTLAASFYNSQWQPAQPAHIQKETKLISITRHFNLKDIFLSASLMVIGLVFLVPALLRKVDIPTLTLPQKQALTLGNSALKTIAEPQPNSWFGVTSVKTFKGNNNNIDLQHRYVWQEEGQETYKKLLFNYVLPAVWVVRFMHHTGTIEERAEEYALCIDTDGKIIRITHKLPQEYPGKTLTQEEARIIALQALNDRFALTQEQVKEISAISEKHPKRLDWKFTFADKQYQLKGEAQARIDVIISGDHVTDYARYVHVPETWIRAQNTQQSLFSLMNTSAYFIFFLLCVCALFFVAGWFKKVTIPMKWALALLGIILLLQISTIILGWPSLICHFNAQEPYNQQIFRLIAGSLVSVIFITSCLAYGSTLYLKAIAQLPGKLDNRLLPLISIALSVFSAGLLTYVKKGQHVFEPLLQDVSLLNNYNPFVSTIALTIMSFIMQLNIAALVVFALVKFFNKTERCWLEIVILALLGFLIAAMTPPLSWHLFALHGLVLAISFNVYFYVLKNSILLALPMIIATITSIACIFKSALGNCPGGCFAQLLAALCVLSIAFGWWYLYQKNTTENTH